MQHFKFLLPLLATVLLGLSNQQTNLEPAVNEVTYALSLESSFKRSLKSVSISVCMLGQMVTVTARHDFSLFNNTNRSNRLHYSTLRPTIIQAVSECSETFSLIYFNFLGVKLDMSQVTVVLRSSVRYLSASGDVGTRIRNALKRMQLTFDHSLVLWRSSNDRVDELQLLVAQVVEVLAHNAGHEPLRSVNEGFKSLRQSLLSMAEFLKMLTSLTYISKRESEEFEILLSTLYQQSDFNSELDVFREDIIDKAVKIATNAVLIGSVAGAYVNASEHHLTNKLPGLIGILGITEVDRQIAKLLEFQREAAEVDSKIDSIWAAVEHSWKDKVRNETTRIRNILTPATAPVEDSSGLTIVALV